MLIQALPGSGKTWLSFNFSKVFDTDDYLEEVYGKSNKTTAMEVAGDPEKAKAFTEWVENHLSDGNVVTTNLHVETFSDLKVDKCFGYQRSDYVRHLELAGRTDLLEKFDSDELESWTDYYVSHTGVVLLKAGEFIGDQVVELGLM